jgi:predicted esterase
MRYLNASWAALGAALLVAACGGGDSGGPLGTQNAAPSRGALMQSPPPRITSMTAGDFNALLNASSDGKSLITLAGTPTCGVDVQYIQYGTVGGAGETTTASGALMVPTGTAANCTGARPIVLYAHGTTVSKNYNLADFADKTNPAYGEAALLAALYAAQGYIVVAPNYAGYDSSTLAYHPYLNADQQSKDMMDALTAAKAALPTLMSGAKASSKLFLTGYSQGGHVAMATHRALQTAGIPVTASAPMSGPYALAAQSDATFYGNVNAGGTVFSPMIFTSFQKAYGNLYSTPADIYDAKYATGIETLIPGKLGFSELFTTGKLPQALFSLTPPAPAFAAITPPTGTGATDALFAAGFGTSFLINNSARAAYLMDAMARPDGAVPKFTNGMPVATSGASASTNPLRVAAAKNDLRGFMPVAPVLLCAGNGDPTVFYSVNTQLMAALWAPQVAGGLVTVLDVDSAAGTPGPTNPFFAVKAGFAQQKAAVAAAGGPVAVVSNYHGGLVPPFCNVAARGFFSNFL